MSERKHYVTRAWDDELKQPCWHVVMPCPQGCPDALEITLHIGDDVGQAVFNMNSMMDAHCKEKHSRPYIIGLSK